MGHLIPPQLPQCDWPIREFGYESCFIPGSWPGVCEGVDLVAFWYMHGCIKFFWQYFEDCDPHWAVYYIGDVPYCYQAPGGIQLYGMWHYLGQVQEEGQYPYEPILSFDPYYFFPVNGVRGEMGDCLDGSNWVRLAHWYDATNVLIKFFFSP
jgi:hypothetical protein